MSFHTGQTFTFGETPSATKWNYIWENDYALADGTGIEDDAILSRHIDDSQILSAHMDIIQTTDANGWNVVDLGTTKLYRKRVTFSQTIGGLAVLTISSTNLPAGVATIGTRNLHYNIHVPGNAGVLQITREGNSGASALHFTAARTDGSSSAYTGYLDLLMVE